MITLHKALLKSGSMMRARMALICALPNKAEADG